jgi:hypothetical protein
MKRDDQACTARSADEEIAANSEALDLELAYIHRELDKDIERAKRQRQPITELLVKADLSDVPRLVRNTCLGDAEKIALCIAMGRIARRPWLKIQDRKYGVLSSIGLAVTSDPWHGHHIAKCSMRGHCCMQPDFCFQCAYWLKQKPAWLQYEGTFERATERGWFVYAVTPSFECDPEQAGLRMVVKKRGPEPRSRDVVKYWWPFRQGDHKRRPPLTARPDADNLDRIKECLNAPFIWLNRLKRHGFILGFFAHRSIGLHFAPFSLVPHVHLVLITRRKITPEVAEEMYCRLIACYTKAAGKGHYYPDLHISPLAEAKELRAWIHYMLRPIDIALPYRDAVRREGDLMEMNYAVEEFYQGGNQVLREARSPRSGGVMRVNSEDYIGTGVTITTIRRAAAEARKKREEAGLPPAPRPRPRIPAGRIEAERRIAAAAARDACEEQ